MRLAVLVIACLAVAACNGDDPDDATKEAATPSASDHAAMGHGPGGASAGDAAFAASEEAMHEAMARASGETLDQAYIAKMIEHHRGAVAMAEVALAQSRDPNIRRMAQTVIDAQTVEIAEMQAWTPSTPVAPPAARPGPVTAAPLTAPAPTPAPTPATEDAAE